MTVLFSQVYLDYEVDSDDEWEEEEPGESLSNSEVNIGCGHIYCRALNIC